MRAAASGPLKGWCAMASPRECIEFANQCVRLAELCKVTRNFANTSWTWQVSGWQWPRRLRLTLSGPCPTFRRLNQASLFSIDVRRRAGCGAKVTIGAEVHRGANDAAFTLLPVAVIG